MMDNRTILITGATSGIGLSISEYLAYKGNKLILVARNEDKLDEVKNKFGRENAITYSVDLRELSLISDIFDDLNTKNIELDGIVHCAGAEGSLSPIRSVKIEALDKLMKLHYESFVEIGRQFYKKRRKKDDACIIGISSLAALMCQKNSVDYSASKAALNVAIKVMAKEFFKNSIRVNGIMPANVDTPMCENLKSIVDIEKIQPMGMIEPIQIAYLTEFLLSEKAKYITGALIPVSAGMEY